MTTSPAGTVFSRLCARSMTGIWHRFAKEFLSQLLGLLGAAPVEELVQEPAGMFRNFRGVGAPGSQSRPRAHETVGRVERLNEFAVEGKLHCTQPMAIQGLDPFGANVPRVRSIGSLDCQVNTGPGFGLASRILDSHAEPSGRTANAWRLLPAQRGTDDITPFNVSAADQQIGLP